MTKLTPQQIALYLGALCYYDEVGLDSIIYPCELSQPVPITGAIIQSYADNYICNVMPFLRKFTDMKPEEYQEFPEMLQENSHQDYKEILRNYQERTWNVRRLSFITVQRLIELRFDCFGWIAGGLAYDLENDRP